MRYQVQRPFHCVIGVTATRLSSKQGMPGQHRHGAPIWAGAGSTEEATAGHLSCPEFRSQPPARLFSLVLPLWPIQKGTALVMRPMPVRNRPEALFFSNPFVVLSVSTRPCEGRGAGANPAKGTILVYNMHKAKSPSH